MADRKRQAGDEIEITEEMRRVGIKVLLESGRTYNDLESSSDGLLVEEIWRAMWHHRRPCEPVRDN